SWKQGNEGVAYFMLQKITEQDEDRLARLVPRDRQQLAAKVLDIGRSVLRKSGSGAAADGKQAQEAVRWLRKAFALVERIEDLPDAPELKVRVRGLTLVLARAYYAASTFDPENLSRAEAALQELIASVDTCEDVQQEEYQELRWMRFSLLKRKKAPEHMILEGFRSVIEHMPWTESGVAELVPEPTKLVTDITQAFLIRALSSTTNDRAAHEFVDRIFLSLIFHCAKDGEHARAVQELEAACGGECSRLPFGLLWQFGDRLYGSKKYTHAADWFILAAHPAFRAMAAANNAKCFRKAALCHIQQNEFAQATALIRRCPGAEASTFYVAFLAAAHQAIRAVRAMAKAPGYDRKMLLLATQLAHERDLKPLLVAILEALLTDLRAQTGIDNEVEAVTLIRQAVSLLSHTTSECEFFRQIRQLVEALVGHFGTARITIGAASAKKTSALITNDVAWLWRAAYNCAVQGCADWPECEPFIADLFELSRALIELDCKASVADPDVETQFHMLAAAFAALTGRGACAIKADFPFCERPSFSAFHARRLATGPDYVRATELRYVRWADADRLPQTACRPTEDREGHFGLQDPHARAGSNYQPLRRHG
ncbi:hypothetical protein AURDEDRAFT_50807, partial [Auricularia subglabra TFB-10046 SS5]